MFAKIDNYAVCLEDYARLKKYAMIPETNEVYSDVEEWLKTNTFLPLPDNFGPPQSSEQRIAELKTLLSESDYKTLPDYDKTDEAILVQRQAWRDEIRTLEGSA